MRLFFLKIRVKPLVECVVGFVHVGQNAEHLELAADWGRALNELKEYSLGNRFSGVSGIGLHARGVEIGLNRFGRQID